MTLALIGIAVMAIALLAGNCGLFHLSLYQLTSGSTGAVTLKDMPAVADPAVTLVNSHPIFQTPIQLYLFYANGQTDITDVQIQTPLLRQIAIPHLRPIDNTTAPQTRPPLMNLLRRPIHLNAIDENSVQITATTFTSGNSYYAACWFGDGNLNADQGDIFTAYFTAAITNGTGAWTNGTITFQNPLPAGTYSVLGMDVWGTGLDFARLIFPQQQQWRPGCIAGAVAGFINAPCFRMGQMGLWGRFASYAAPQLDCFSYSGTGSAQTGLLDLVKVA